MGQKFTLDEKEYDIEDLSASANANMVALQFTTNRINELDNMLKLLECAKNGYITSLKKEIVSEKAGFLLEN